MRTVALAAFATLLAARPAVADTGWSRTFDPAAVGSYVEEKASFLVAGAGTGTPSLAAASAALEAALKACGKADLVMNGRTLGAVGDLDDPNIVEKAAALPVALVAVVRVFEEPSGPANVVVTVYEKKGALRFALSGKEGQPLAAKASGGLGVSHAAVRSVAETALGNAGSPAQDEYDQKHVFFEDFASVGVNQYGTVVSRTMWSQAFQGKYRKPISGAAFYDTVGHPEMAEHYREVSASNSAWMWVSAGLAAATFGAGTYLLFAGAKDGSNIGLAMGLMLGGPLLVGGGVCLATRADPESVDGPGARKLVDEYDQALKRRLNLSALEGESDEAKATRVAFGVAPTAGGAMVAAGASF